MADVISSETFPDSQLDVTGAKPTMGGGLPVIGYWAEKTLDLKGQYCGQIKKGDKKAIHRIRCKC
jgi:hypothetical protein